MPDNQEFQLPQFQRKNIFNFHRLHFSRICLHDSDDRLSDVPFLWKIFQTVKGHNACHVQKISECEILHPAARTNVYDNASTAEFAKKNVELDEIGVCFPKFWGFVKLGLNKNLIDEKDEK